MLLLVQAGATGARPQAPVGPSPSPTPPCARTFRIAFVSDVAGLDSATDAAGWQGVQQAMRQMPCLKAELVTSRQPTDYRAELQAAVGRHSDLIIAGSFLLTDEIVHAAIANPSTDFVLVYPLVAVSGPPNLASVTFREDEAGFLAGALAGLTTRTNIVAGVYGLEDDHDRRFQQGFERGAHSVDGSVRVLGAYQGPQDGSPYANPEWGAAQAQSFLAADADVIFASGDLTGLGALSATSQVGKACITVGLSVDSPAPRCLTGTVLLQVDRAVAIIVSEAAGGRWRGGSRSFGLADGVIEIQLGTNVRSDVRARLRAVARGIQSAAFQGPP